MERPTAWRSSMRNLPLGFMSAMTGVLLLASWMSSRVRGTSDACAMAKRWSTALVEPPSAMMTASALSKAARVMMSRGLMSFCSSVKRALQFMHAAGYLE